MKTTICIFAVSFSAALTAYAPIRSASTGSLLQNTEAVPPPVAPALYHPKDPGRVLNGVRYALTGVDAANGWVEFEGTVLEVQTNGLRLSGGYTGNSGADGKAVEFFVTNFPYPLAEGEKITVDSARQEFFIAHTAGVYAYHKVPRSLRTLRMLDYGRIYVPSAADLAAAQKAAQAKKDAAKVKADEARARALKMNQDAAEKGDAYGLLRMGERYRDGEGVEKDAARARDYLQRAAAAGSQTAADELKKLQ
jgi:hypothetical protein